ncbi:MAG: hypothetical protein DWQ01_02010 [Planctomycetota bacterium]|nr:MAG: hypothetical protein DWQ01_02010 [Planctomycetota bacterium]
MFQSLRLFLVVAIGLGLMTLISASDLRMPGNDRGYSPEQPIAFSHRLHAGELKMDCLFCHYGARKSRHAGIPPVELCLNCHLHVKANLDDIFLEKAAAEAEGREERPLLSSEIEKIYQAAGINADGEPLEGQLAESIPWVRIHRLPDHVYFDHRVHVAGGVACQSCHGPVQAMERARQEHSLSMGWCMDCHRQTKRSTLPGDGASNDPGATNPSVDCAVCHY